MFAKNKALSLLLSSIIASSYICAFSAPTQTVDIDTRIKRQMRRIEKGEQDRTLGPKQAKALKGTLNDIGLKVDAARKKNGGQLTEAQQIKFNNDLNQNFDSIQTYLGAGKKVKTKGNVLGPNWANGTDGAQDPQALKRQMRVQEQRQRKQYEQAMQQVQEMHQQQYEQEMLKTLGNQRPQILENKRRIEKIREQTGAN